MLNKSLPTMFLVDEHELLNKAQSILQSSHYCRDKLKVILQGCRDSDERIALTYQYIRHHHKNFIDALNTDRETAANKQVRWHFIIVPALLHRIYPALGGNGKLFSDIACKLGHSVELLNIDGGRTQAETSQALAEAIDRYTANAHKKLCLVGISRGTADIFSYLDSYGNEKVNLVVNIAGIIKGTPLASHILSTFARRLKYRLIAAYCKIDFKAIADLSCENPIYENSHRIAGKVKLINFIGTPLKSHVQPHLLKRYLRLNRRGPNDGMVMIDDYLDFPGLTYPIWGGDHFFRLPGYSNLLFNFINALDEIALD